MPHTLGDLKPDSRNARKHNPRNVGQIETSIQRDGFGRPMLLANDGTIIAGNATYDAALSAGLDDLIVVESDGTKVIAVKRTDVAPGSDRFRNLALADNRAAELADWDADVIAALADDGVDLSQFFYEPELDRVLNGLAQMPDFDPNAEWQGMPEFHQDDLTAEFQCRVNFKSIEDVAAFEELIGQHIPRNTKSVWYPPQERQNVRALGYVSDAA